MSSTSLAKRSPAHRAASEVGVKSGFVMSWFPCASVVPVRRTILGEFMAESPEMSFNALVVSMATTAAVHLGDAAAPGASEKQPPNLEAAGHMLDLLNTLADKTKGNLTPDEERFLTQVLYELRMRFIEAEKDESPIVTS